MPFFREAPPGPSEWQEDAAARWEDGNRYYTAAVEFGEQSETDVASILESIEACGWRLLDSGYVFKHNKHKAHPGASMTIVGEIVGIFTFGRPDSA